MKFQSLFSGKNKKNISNCHLLSFLSSVQSISVLLLCSSKGGKYDNNHN